jgi:hypothetical protein
VFAGGWNPSKAKVAASASVAEIKAEEADAWYAASELAMWSGQRKADDLFTARRLVIGALVFAVLASPFLLIASAQAPPNKTDSSPTLSPTPSTTRSPGRHVSKAGGAATPSISGAKHHPPHQDEPRWVTLDREPEAPPLLAWVLTVPGMLSPTDRLSTSLSVCKTDAPAIGQARQADLFDLDNPPSRGSSAPAGDF